MGIDCDVVILVDRRRARQEGFFGREMRNFNRIDATAYYPTKPSSAIGGGSLTNVQIKKNSKFVPSLLPSSTLLTPLPQFHRPLPLLDQLHDLIRLGLERS